MSRADVLSRVAAAVGDDGTGDNGVVVDCVMRDYPNETEDRIVEIAVESIRDARDDWAAEVAS